MIIVNPSILAADFTRLGEQVRDVENGGAERLHIDVMDGHFVPNLSMGPAIVKSVRGVTKLPLEIHLMVEDPARFVPLFIAAGADILIGHHEVLPDPRTFLKSVRGQGKKAGLAINPENPIEGFQPYLADMDVALCMTVHPGFAGQSFLPESPGRIRKLRQLIDRINPGCDLEVDGGIDEKTVPLVVREGANVLVSATGVFHAPEGPSAAVRKLLAWPEVRPARAE